MRATNQSSRSRPSGASRYYHYLGRSARRWVTTLRRPHQNRTRTSQHMSPGMKGTRRRDLIHRAAVATGAAAVLLGVPAGAAAAGTGPAVLAFRPAPFNFGTVPVGQQRAETFTLANTGGRASSALTVTLSGPAAFSITADTCRSSLAPGTTCTITVRFAPARVGAVTATLTAVSKNRAATASDALTGAGPGLGSAPGHLYWDNAGNINQNNGTINAANLDGTDPTTLVTGQDQPFGLAADSSHIYWANNAAVTGTINAVPLAGGTPTTLVTMQNTPAGVAVDSSHIYWANGQDGTIDAAPLTGGTPTFLVSGQDGPSGVAVDGSHIYWANIIDGTINEANLDGTDVTTLVTGQNGPVGVAVDSSHIYWANEGGINGGGAINEANLDGSDPTTLVTGGSPSGVAVDSSHIYWTNPGAGTIDQANLDGTDVTTLVTGQNGPFGVAVVP